MRRWILALDRLLRGETTQVDRLREGTSISRAGVR